MNANAPHPDRTRFFVRGYMRSGTTWMRALLNTHPRVVCGGEFNLANPWLQVRHITENLRWCEGATDPRVREAMIRGYHDWVRTVLDAIADRKPGATHVGDCTPHEFFGILPGASYILLTRDGRDVLVSWTYRALWNDSAPEPGTFPTYPDLRRRFEADPEYFLSHPGELLGDETWVRHVARDWARRVDADARKERDVREGRFDARVIRTTYEALHADTQGERARLFEFLGLDPGEASELSREDRTLAGLDSERPGAHLRKGEPGDYRHYMTGASARWFDDEAGDALIDAGYESDHDWVTQTTTTSRRAGAAAGAAC